MISIIRGLKRSLETISGKLVHISDELLHDLCSIANDNYPLESFAFLRLIDGIFKEYVLAPRAYKSETSVVFFSHEIDLDHTLVATCHSHPSNNFHPSDADLQTFRKKPVNIILGYPYRALNLGVYDSKGNPLDYDLIF